MNITVCKLKEFGNYFTINIPYDNSSYKAIHDEAIKFYREEGSSFYQDSRNIEVGFELEKVDSITMLNHFENFIRDYSKCIER